MADAERKVMIELGTKLSGSVGEQLGQFRNQLGQLDPEFSRQFNKILGKLRELDPEAARQFQKLRGYYALMGNEGKAEFEKIKTAIGGVNEETVKGGTHAEALMGHLAKFATVGAALGLVRKLFQGFIEDEKAAVEAMRNLVQATLDLEFTGDYAKQPEWRKRVFEAAKAAARPVPETAKGLAAFEAATSGMDRGRRDELWNLIQGHALLTSAPMTDLVRKYTQGAEAFPGLSPKQLSNQLKIIENISGAGEEGAASWPKFLAASKQLGLAPDLATLIWTRAGKQLGAKEATSGFEELARGLMEGKGAEMFGAGYTGTERLMTLLAQARQEQWTPAQMAEVFGQNAARLLRAGVAEDYGRGELGAYSVARERIRGLLGGEMVASDIRGASEETKKFWAQQRQQIEEQQVESERPEATEGDIYRRRLNIEMKRAGTDNAVRTMNLMIYDFMRFMGSSPEGAAWAVTNRATEQAIPMAARESAGLSPTINATVNIGNVSHEDKQKAADAAGAAARDATMQALETLQSSENAVIGNE